MLAWFRRGNASERRIAIDRTVAGAPPERIDLTLRWELPVLSGIVPGLEAHAERLRKQTSPQREHVTELASYALAFVGVSALMPGRRVVRFHKGYAPDLLFDVTPSALKGVEVAGRSTGGSSALRVVRDGANGDTGKATQLRAATHIAEAHLSLWCESPSVGVLEQVKP